MAWLIWDCVTFACLSVMTRRVVKLVEVWLRVPFSVVCGGSVYSASYWFGVVMSVYV